MIEHNEEYYSKYPYIFHKFLLNISSYSSDLNYSLVKELQDVNNCKCYWAHLHCFNIDEFQNFYGQYIERISMYFNILITYSNGTILPELNSIILKCDNRGMDIGGKIIFMDYLKRNNLQSEHVLFLHSKSCPNKRHAYFEPIINNLQFFSEQKDSYGVFAPPIILHGDSNHIFGKRRTRLTAKPISKKNLNYFNEFCSLLDLNNNYFLFPEGNCYILKWNIAEFLFQNVLYYLLNTFDSFDPNWVYTKYRQNSKNIHDIYRFYNERKVFGNNIVTQQGHNGLPDAQIEHVFERLIFNVMKKMNEKLYIFEYNNADRNTLNNATNFINNEYNGNNETFIHLNTNNTNRDSYVKKTRGKILKTKTLGIYLFKNEDLDFYNFNVLIHNLKMLLQSCDDIYIIEIHNDKKTKIGNCLMRLFGIEHKRFTTIYMKYNPELFNLSYEELYLFVTNNIKNTRHIKLSNIINYMIINTNDVIIHSLQEFKNLCNHNNNYYSLQNNIYYIKGVPFDNLKHKLNNKLRIDTHNLDVVVKNDDIFYNETQILLNYHTYCRIYNSNLTDNVLDCDVNIYNYIKNNFNDLFTNIVKMFPVLMPNKKFDDDKVESKCQDDNTESNSEIVQEEKNVQNEEVNQVVHTESNNNIKNVTTSKKPFASTRKPRSPFMSMNYFSSKNLKQPKTKSYYSF